MTTVSDVVELVRAPAALTVLGDTLAGGHAGGARFTGRQWLLPLASVCLYSGGMALNDLADRELDAVERPERPIPSGRVAPRTARAIVGGCFGAGLALAAAGGGRRGFGVAVPLVAAIVLYNTVAKSTPLGPVSMAACRGLDVLMGASSPSRALVPATVMAVHTFGVTVQSRGEVHGGSPAAATTSLAATAVSTAGALAGTSAPSSSRVQSTGRAIGVALATATAAAGYLASTLPTQLRTLDEPSAANARAATRAGIGAMIPLQATLTARSGAVLPTAILAGVELARRALSARKRGGDVT